MIRCGGPCNKRFESPDPYNLPEDWRYVKSKDPNAPRIELAGDFGQGITVLPSSGPSVGMCPDCASVAEAAESN